jgi:maleylacetoacetate isomerase
MLKLYNYFRSSASYRVRIALHFKGLPFEYIPVHLVKNGGIQNSAEFRKVNPMSHVPALVDGDFAVGESVAIFDYLDHIHPEKPLWPKDPKIRARTLQIAEIINSGIQPLHNLKVTTYLEKEKGWDKAQSTEWVQHWMKMGLTNLEKLLGSSSGTYAVGDQVTGADMFIVPQTFACTRFSVDTKLFPLVTKVSENAKKLEAFQKAHPEKQIDFES